MDKSTQVIEHSSQALICLTPVSTPHTGSTVYCHLRCLWCIPYHPGTHVMIEIGSHQEHARAQATVTDCDLEEDGYRIELGILDPEQAFRLRMVEQLCHIRDYQDQVSRYEGRRLNGEQAAHEWIARYAQDFPAA